MNISDKLLDLFFVFVSWGLKNIPWLTVWTAERVFYIFPGFMRSLVEKYTSNRILACVVGGNIPFLPDINGGDVLLFYPLSQCVGYEVLEYPDISPVPLFEGKILGMIIPKDQRLPQYHLCGYDKQGNCFPAGILISHSTQGATQIRNGINMSKNEISWDVNTSTYMTSFLIIHSRDKPHAAGYSQTRHWYYPDTIYLPHIVIPPDGTPLSQEGISVMIMVVNKDGWVPEILIWSNKS